jgi:hypothetical protein
MRQLRNFIIILCVGSQTLHIVILSVWLATFGQAFNLIEVITCPTVQVWTYIITIFVFIFDVVALGVGELDF